MTPHEESQVRSIVCETIPDADLDTVTQVIDLITSRFEFPHGETRKELIEELAQLTMDEIDATT